MGKPLIWMLIPNEIAMKLRGLLLSASVNEKVANCIVGQLSIEMLSTGLKTGASDVLIIGNGKVLFYEFKLEHNNQQKNQIEFQQSVERLGHTYRVIKSLDQFKECIKHDCQ